MDLLFFRNIKQNVYIFPQCKFSAICKIIESKLMNHGNFKFKSIMSLRNFSCILNEIIKNLIIILFYCPVSNKIVVMMYIGYCCKENMLFSLSFLWKLGVPLINVGDLRWNKHQKPEWKNNGILFTHTNPAISLKVQPII